MVFSCKGMQAFRQFIQIRKRMATPKRKFKIRDHEATRRKLLETVGDILRDTGYAGLKTNNIARRAGKDKSLIRYYFQSLANLQKTYIKENDYWLVFFENISIPEKPGPEALKTLFADLMKANFNFFRDNIEMQKIILWQISEINPLMRSVSDQREREGGKLLGMTDPFFRDSDINFRALVAIILGGTYYLVLHAETNKSTVCGIDINMEKDRLAVLACIDQLVGKAWDQHKPAVGSSGGETEADETAEIERVVSRLGLGNDTGKDPVTARAFGAEAQHLRTVVLRQMMRNRDHNRLSEQLELHLARLTSLCDLLYLAGISRREDASAILGMIREISSTFYEQMPGEAILPVLFRRTEGEKLMLRWRQLEKDLTGQGTDPMLIRIMALPFIYFHGGETKLCWAEYRYLANYTTGIVQQAVNGTATSRDWMELLISLGYNHSRFSVWCFGLIQRSIANKGQEEAIAILSNMRTAISLLVKDVTMHFEPRRPHIADEIDQWIAEELAIIADRVNSGAEDLRLKLEALQLSYWQDPGAAGLDSAQGRETLKMMEAKLLVLLEQVRYSMQN